MWQRISRLPLGLKESLKLKRFFTGGLFTDHSFVCVAYEWERLCVASPSLVAGLLCSVLRCWPRFRCRRLRAAPIPIGLTPIPIAVAPKPRGRLHEVTGSVREPQPQRYASVQSAPLPPPNAPYASPPPTRPAAGQLRRRDNPAARPAWRPIIRAARAPNRSRRRRAAQPVARSGWNWEGGTAITVQRGDAIDSVTKRYGVPASAIAEANNLPNGSTLRPGQRLVIPKYEVTGSTNAAPRSGAPMPLNAAAVAPKPQMPMSPPPTYHAAAPRGSGPHVHIIGPGETLMKLSRQYNKPLIEIARANHIPPSTMVKVGDRIVIPGVKGAPQQFAARQPAPAPMAAVPAEARARCRAAAGRAAQACQCRAAEGRRAGPAAGCDGAGRACARADRQCGEPRCRQSGAAEGEAGGDGCLAGASAGRSTAASSRRSGRSPRVSRTMASTSRCRRARRSRPPRTASWLTPATSSRPTATWC